MNLVYPRSAKLDTLEYEWEGYSAVVVFSSEDDLTTVKDWYWRQPRSSRVIDDAEDGETAQCHFFADSACRIPLAEICLAGPESFDDLASYIGSPALDKMIRDNPQTIGVLFLRKNTSNEPTSG